MADLQVGDTIFHYWAGRIQAFSSVTEAAVNSSIPSELTDKGWQRDGRLARVHVEMLSDPVSLEDIPLGWRLEEGGPFNRKGSVNQGYLYPVSEDFVARVSGRFPQLAEGVSIDPVIQSAAATAYIEPNFETIRSRIEIEGLVISDRTLLRFHLSCAPVVSSSSLVSQGPGRHGLHRRMRALSAGVSSSFRWRPTGRQTRTCSAT